MEKSIPFENEYIHLEYREDILYGRKPIHIDLELPRKIVDRLLKYSDSQEEKFLLQQNGFKSINREASFLFSSEEGTSFVVMVVIISRKTLKKYLANYFLQILFLTNLKSVKTFHMEDKAFDWLQKI